MTRAELWAELTGVGLVTGEMPSAAPRGTPWPVRVMMGAAGWVGALFLLGFAGVAFAAIFRSADAAIPAGLLCCAGAFGVFVAMPRNDFAGQFGLAVSLTGQALVLVGLVQLTHEKPQAGTFFAMAAFQAVLAWALPNYVHRAFTALSANACLFLGAGMMGAPALGTAVAAVGAALPWLFEKEMAAQPAVLEPLAYGCAIALLHMDGSLLFGHEFWEFLRPKGEKGPEYVMWLGAAVCGAVLVFAAWRLGARGALLAGAVAVGVSGVFAPGISAALLVMVLGFASGRRPLLGLGILAFLGYLGHFYYSLEVTLLMKSAALCGTGLLLLGMRFLVREGRDVA